MGQFSWKFCDEPEMALNIGEKGYLLCPDGNHIVEKEYDGYGNFGSRDVYDLVAAWNRKYIAEHPEHTLRTGARTVKDMPWYSVYADLSVPIENVCRECVQKGLCSEDFRLRDIGIDIACIDEDNKRLPFPIKICRKNPNRMGFASREVAYTCMPPSNSDPNQGWG